MHIYKKGREVSGSPFAVRSEGPTPPDPSKVKVIGDGRLIKSSRINGGRGGHEKFRHKPPQLIVEYYLHWTTTFEISFSGSSDTNHDSLL